MANILPESMEGSGFLYTGISGTVDAGYRIFADPTLLLGKAKKVYDVANYSLVKIIGDPKKLDQAFNKKPVVDFFNQYGSELQALSAARKAKDIEDYSKLFSSKEITPERDFNFPPNFLEITLLYPHVEYKLEHDFGDFKMLGYIDNMSKDYELVVDFKTGTAPWSTQRLQESLQMQTYSLILWYKFGVMPTSVISYWKTKLRGKTLSWAGEHESFMYVFNTEELTAAEARIRKAAKEISEALVYSVASLAFGCLGLTSAEKIFKKNEK